MDQSEFDIVEADLPQRADRSQAARAKKFRLTRVTDRTLPEALVARGRRAIARLGAERLRQSYFTTFWIQAGARPGNVIEEMVLALSRRAGVRCVGMERWIGPSHTTHLPIEFHFDHDVKAGARHRVLSSVFFF